MSLTTWLERDCPVLRVNQLRALPFSAQPVSLITLTANGDQVITMAQKQATRTNQAITLKGSTAIVTEFLEYSVNSILYQRGVYPSDDFRYVHVTW